MEHDEEGEAEAAAETSAGSAAGSGEIPLLTNGQLAQVFHDIGDLLEVKGELVFKTVAYHRAADAIGRSPIEVARAYREGKPPEIPGVGKAISDKLAELATTGRSEYRDKLLAEFPTSLLEMLRLPGLGPKTVRAIYAGLGVKTLDELKAAAETGRVRTLRGLSERTEQMILEGIAKLEIARGATAPQPRQGAGRRDLGGSGRGPRRRADRAGGLLPAPKGDDRRPRPARGD